MQTAKKHNRSQDESGNGLKRFRSEHVSFLVIAGLLCLLFNETLRGLWQLSLSSDLYSHLFLIPAISAFLAATNPKKSVTKSPPARLLAILIAILAVPAFLASRNAHANLAANEVENYLAYSTLCFVILNISGLVFLFGKDTAKNNLFPIILLLFMAPFPTPMREAIEYFFQYTSAETAYWLINWSGIPIYREGLVFVMPNIRMEVAPECSGIRSSLVLFIVSLVGSYMLLRSYRYRAIVTFLVIPLGIVRNAIRILILAQLCFQIGPHMIDSWFHHSGGPPLFAITLIPLFALLVYFWKKDDRTKQSKESEI